MAFQCFSDPLRFHARPSQSSPPLPACPSFRAGHYLYSRQFAIDSLPLLPPSQQCMFRRVQGISFRPFWDPTSFSFPISKCVFNPVPPPPNVFARPTIPLLPSPLEPFTGPLAAAIFDPRMIYASSPSRCFSRVLQPWYGSRKISQGILWASHQVRLWLFLDLHFFRCLFPGCSLRAFSSSRFPPRSVFRVFFAFCEANPNPHRALVTPKLFFGSIVPYFQCVFP